MDEEQEEESSDEDPEYDEGDNISLSHFLTWQKSQFLSKSFPDDTIEEDYTVNILSPMGYLEKYFPEEFYEIGAFNTSLYYSNQHNRELKPMVPRRNKNILWNACTDGLHQISKVAHVLEY
ncbi:hypothetical protein JTB14_035537 [Gonioctena quinquepunctata]|nr:hypothetical protein JTB14_035537 [Gonioctena quinquepunctata]